MASPKGGRRKTYHDVDELKQKPTVKRWQEQLADGPSRRAALYGLARYLRSRKSRGMETDPDKLIQECLDGNNRTNIRHLLELVDYCTNSRGDAKGATQKRAYVNLRSFYRHNFVALPEYKLKPTTRERVVKEGFASFTTRFLQMVKKVLLNGRLTPRDRAIILTMVQTGMDASTTALDFNYYAYGQLVEYFGTEDYRRWNTGMCPVLIHLDRLKTSTPHYSFVDVDGVVALKEWLAVREEVVGQPITIYPAVGDEINPRSEPIFVKMERRKGGEHEGPKSATFSKVFHDAGFRAGVNVAPTGAARPKGADIRYPFASHRCRHYLISLARKRTDGKNVKVDVEVPMYITGHAINRLGYDHSPESEPDYFREEYLKLSRPFLNPVSDIQEGTVKSHEIAELKKQVAEMQRRLKRITRRPSA